MELSALAINVAIPVDLRWRDMRRDEDPVSGRPEITALVSAAADEASRRWAAHT